jgi:hypothetical protein
MKEAITMVLDFRLCHGHSDGFAGQRGKSMYQCRPTHATKVMMGDCNAEEGTTL